MRAFNSLLLIAGMLFLLAVWQVFDFTAWSRDFCLAFIAIWALIKGDK